MGISNLQINRLDKEQLVESFNKNIGYVAKKLTGNDLITQAEAAEARGVALRTLNQWVRRERVHSEIRYGTRLVSRVGVLTYNPRANKGEATPVEGEWRGEEAARAHGREEVDQLAARQSHIGLPEYLLGVADEIEALRARRAEMEALASRRRAAGLFEPRGD